MGKSLTLYEYKDKLIRDNKGKEEILLIKEVIVVEGKDDVAAVKKAVDAEMIAVGGFGINARVIARIKEAQKRKGVIVLTDPDFAGEKIRKIIMEAVPQAKHAFLPRTQAKPKKKGSLGVEHASDAAILEALKKVVTPDISQTAVSEITRQDLIDYGLIAGAQAKEKREKLGDELRIGYTNGKQLEKRLKMFRITPKELAQAMKIVEEQHE